jgi:hypothetical protein
MSDLDGLYSAARAEQPDAARRAQVLAALRAAAGGPPPGSPTGGSTSPTSAPTSRAAHSAQSSSEALAPASTPATSIAAPTSAGSALVGKSTLVVLGAALLGWMLTTLAPEPTPGAAPTTPEAPVARESSSGPAPLAADAPQVVAPQTAADPPQVAAPQAAAEAPRVADDASSPPVRAARTALRATSPTRKSALAPAAQAEAPAEDPLALEVVALEAARQAHARGDDDDAAAMIDAYLVRHPHGQLRPEAWALALTLAQARGDDAATARLRAARDAEAR